VSLASGARRCGSCLSRGISHGTTYPRRLVNLTHRRVCHGHSSCCPSSFPSSTLLPDSSRSQVHSSSCSSYTQYTSLHFNTFLWQTTPWAPSNDSTSKIPPSMLPTQEWSGCLGPLTASLAVEQYS